MQLYLFFGELFLLMVEFSAWLLKYLWFSASNLDAAEKWCTLSMKFLKHLDTLKGSYEPHVSSYFFFLFFWKKQILSKVHLKTPMEEGYFFVKLQAKDCSITKSNTPWVFFTFFKLCKWNQIVQSIALAYIWEMHENSILTILKSAEVLKADGLDSLLGSFLKDGKKSFCQTY